MGVSISIGKVDNIINNYDYQLSQVSSFRQNRINSYKLEDDKRRSLAATIQLDRLLELRELRERDMTYYLGENGKPYFENSSLFFSLSHSGNYSMAVLNGYEIGCDIQTIVPADLKLANRFFTPNEAKYITDDVSFTRLWTLKESFIKLTGRGLSMPLNSFEIFNFTTSHPYIIFNNEKYIFNTNQKDEYIYSICKKARE